MVLQNHIVEFLQELVRLISIEFVDVFREWSNGIDALPAGDWVGSDNRVNGSQLASDVLRATSDVFVNADLLRVLFCRLDEAIPSESCG